MSSVDLDQLVQQQRVSRVGHGQLERGQLVQHARLVHRTVKHMVQHMVQHMEMRIHRMDRLERLVRR